MLFEPVEPSKAVRSIFIKPFKPHETVGSSPLVWPNIMPNEMVGSFEPFPCWYGQIR